MMLMASGTTARVDRRCFRPRSINMRLAFGESCRPAPASSSRSAFSSTTTRKPLVAKASAAVSPPIPAPAMKMVRDVDTLLSGDVLQHAFRRAGLAGSQIGRETIQRRAIGADDLVVIAEIKEDMRMVERRIGTHTHE